MLRHGLVATILALAAVAVVAASATAGAHRVTVSAQDETWLKTSAQGDYFEIECGKLALQKAQSSGVRQLAQRLIKDHAKSLADAKKTAATLGIKLENSPTPSEQWELKVVNGFSGSAFDRWYSSLEVKDHQQDIQETSDEVAKGTNPDVRKDAKQDLPGLK